MDKDDKPPGGGNPSEPCEPLSVAGFQ